MTDEIDWFISFRSSPQYTLLKKRPIVYFCAEYALSDTIPIYAGGLGVLAGDYIREAVDQQIPFIAVGLYYNESVNLISPDKLGLNPVVDNSGKRLTVEVPIAERTVYVRAWTKKIGSINVYLLDTCFEENSIPDQKITSRLYVADAETRLKQQIILGIGGLRVIEALGIHPIVYHMNEGHSAMLATELVRHEMSERKIGFPEAKRYIRNRLVFTNHTLVPAGNDLFTDDMVSALLRKYAEEIEIPVHELIELGRVGESSMFSNTLFSLRMADKVNTVSKIHAKKAAEIWHDHPMESITNGIHLSSWDRIGTTDFIWEDHQRNKEKLLDLIKKETGQVWSKNNLLLGWARRMTNYKRPLAILENMDRFIQIAKKSDTPVQIVFSGEAHSEDNRGLEIIRTLRARVKNELNGIAIYLPGYNSDLARLMVSGCDVWVNTPVVGSEACGTSGMKACLNGVLPLTTKDGWVDEVNLYGIGWIVDSDKISIDILDVLERDIVPLYYMKKTGENSEWVKNMRYAREMIINEFSTTKMFKEYIQRMYLSSINS